MDNSGFLMASARPRGASYNETAEPMAYICLASSPKISFNRAAEKAMRETFGEVPRVFLGYHPEKKVIGIWPTHSSQKLASGCRSFTLKKDKGHNILSVSCRGFFSQYKEAASKIESISDHHFMIDTDPKIEADEEKRWEILL